MNIGPKITKLDHQIYFYQKFQFFLKHKVNTEDKIVK